MGSQWKTEDGAEVRSLNRFTLNFKQLQKHELNTTTMQVLCVCVCACVPLLLSL